VPSTLWESPPWFGVGGRDRTKLALKGEPSSAMATISVVAGEGAIDPFAKRSGGLAWADGIGGAAVGPYSPSMVVVAGGEYVVLPG
jgi:hypothetical protein